MEQKLVRVVGTRMTSGRTLRAFCVVAAAACCGSAGFAKDEPRPAISIEPIVATGLLAPIDEAASAASYRLDPAMEAATGQRAKLSIEVGKTTMYAITGRLERQKSTIGPLETSQAGVLGPRRESGKVYGAGVSGKFHGVDVSATYQYNKIRSEPGEVDTIAGGPGRSHSLRATARIRFRR
jgi:hypothetical protein